MALMRLSGLPGLGCSPNPYMDCDPTSDETCSFVGLKMNPDYCGDLATPNPASQPGAATGGGVPAGSSGDGAAADANCFNMQYAGGLVNGLQAWFRDPSGAQVWGFSPKQAVQAVFSPITWGCNFPFAIGILIPPVALTAILLGYFGRRR
jgi:hypothetical protein